MTTWQVLKTKKSRLEVVCLFNFNLTLFVSYSYLSNCLLAFNASYLANCHCIMEKWTSFLSYSHYKVKWIKFIQKVVFLFTFELGIVVIRT